MVDALVSGVIEQLISIPRVAIEKEVKLVVSVKKEIKKLEITLRVIQAVLEDAERQQVSNKDVQVWLAELKNAAYDADDILDEWRTIIGMKKQVCTSLFSRFKSTVKSPYVHHEIGHGLREINERLDGISNGMKKFQFNMGRTVHDEQKVQQQNHKITSSVVHESDISGRIHDKEVILSNLLGETSSNANLPPFAIICIVGMGGIGKTTLAQLVFNDETVKTSFDKTIWVCVSDPFDKVRVARAIIEAIDGHQPSVLEWDALHSHLSRSLTGLRFLLVLDDVWTENYSIWEPLELSLRGGAPGSKTVVTTRNERVAQMMGSAYLHSLGKLSKEDCWTLFSRRAFAGWTEEERRMFEGVGKKITEKCKGLPLAAKALGSLMQFKKKRQDWQNVLESKTWAETSVLPALLLSYYDLSPQLKRCFVYCAIFPQDFGIVRARLIKLWMANGFLNSNLGEGDQLEVMGGQCFDNLVARSFLQIDNPHNHYRMHDLIYEFAQSLAKNECMSLRISMNNDAATTFMNCANVRHLHVETANTINVNLPSSSFSCSTMSALRTLYNGRRNGIVDEESVSAVVNSFKRLRVLDLNFSGLTRVPNGVEKLIHLRFLDLSGNHQLTEIPDTVCNLYNLQTLNLFGSGNIKSISKGFGNLVNLRHLILSDFRGGLIPKGIGRLSSLRMLGMFHVGSSQGSASAARMAELKNLNQLQELHLDGLKRVESGKEASQAQLVKKQYLSFLRLSFGGYGLSEESVKNGEEEMERLEDILDCLEPPHLNLETLVITDYGGSRFPTWMASDLLASSSKLGCLHTFQLAHCKHLKAEHHQSFPDTLAELSITNCPKLGWTSLCLPPLLKKLTLHEDVGVLSRKFPILCCHPNHNKVKSLRVCFSPVSVIPEGLGQLTSLTRLDFLACHSIKLTSEEIQPLSMLQELTIDCCGELSNRCAGEGAQDWEIISHIPNITIDHQKIQGS